MDVNLQVYDLSRGMARQMSMGLLGFQLDAIYHTSILLNGLEYVYDGGIIAIQPGSSHLGRPMESIRLGRTQLPMDVVEDYLDSIKGVYTAAAYDLWRHNCNNFSNDFSTFLVGNGIPDHIINMPQAVMDSPLGAMLLPALNQGVNANRQQNGGGMLGLAATSQVQRSHAVAAAGHQVRSVSSLKELDALLLEAKQSCAVIFFTSATCPPCKTLYPLYEELAQEVGNKGILIKVDISQAYDVGARYSVRATPTFLTLLKGEEENRWSGADSAALRGNTQLLVNMAWPRHPHESLNLPTFRKENSRPVLFAKVPPLSKLLSKAGPLVDVPEVKGVASFIEAREKNGPASTHLPDVTAFGLFMQGPFLQLPREVLFTMVDLLRCALVDPRFSGCMAEEKGHRTIISILSHVNGLANCPYNLRLVTSQMACNLFSSRLYSDQILEDDQLRAPIIQLLSSNFLDETNNNIRVVAASLLFNLSQANNAKRRDGSGDILPEEDQIELAASTLEAISEEEKSSEALEGMLLALGYLVYRLPLDGELADLLRTLEADETVMGKKAHFKDMALITEVGSELLKKGLRKS